ncbi:MAG: hypothetical protein M1546_21330, partial [Chloroflexi bacterium]|nr:hypothetical protein [Chloroflexota bacterium]
MKTNRRHAPVVRPSVVFSPNLADGINAMADAVKPTIGPLPRLVGVERMNRSRMPEILDDAGVIARRIIQIEDQTADVGAMMLRHGMWRMHERMGDGAATTAVLAQAIMQHAVRGVAAGMHPMWLRRGIETGVATVAGELRRLARPLPPGKAGRALLASLAHSLSADSELMDALVQVVNQIGSEGAVEVVVNERRTIDREFIEGAMWNMGWVSPAFLTDRLKGIARQEDVSVILFDGKIETGRQAADSIRRWSELGIQSVALVVNDVAEEALQVYIQAHLQKLLGLILIKLPIVGDEKLTALQDISALTGARILFDIGELMALQQEDAGFARRMWSTAIKFGIIAGARNGEMLRARADAVRTAIANFNDKKEWEQLRKLRWRLAQLTGGIAVLQIGAVTRSAADT